MTDQELKDLIASTAALQAETAKQMQETKEFIKETSRQIQETERIMNERSKETDAKFRESERIMNERSRESERVMNERFKETDDKFKETERIMNERSKEIKQISQDIGGVSHSNSLVAEEYFFNALKDKLKLGEMRFDRADLGRNRCGKLPDGSKIKGQYDIILANGDAVAAIEVKYKARTEDIDKMIKTDAHKFRQLYPEYKDYKLYFGIAGLNLDEHVEKKALENGIAVLRQKGDVAEILDGNLRAF